MIFSLYLNMYMSDITDMTREKYFMLYWGSTHVETYIPKVRENRNVKKSSGPYLVLSQILFVLKLQYMYYVLPSVILFSDSQTPALLRWYQTKLGPVQNVIGRETSVPSPAEIGEIVLRWIQHRHWKVIFIIQCEVRYFLSLE